MHVFAYTLAAALYRTASVSLATQFAHARAGAMSSLHLLQARQPNGGRR
jgi:hypothetical protein